jgi:hypothetical protein
LHLQKLPFFGDFFPFCSFVASPIISCSLKKINIVVACFHHHGFSIVFYKYIIVSIIVSI